MIDNPYAVAEPVPVASVESLIGHIKAIGNSIAIDELRARILIQGDPLVERTLAQMRVKTGITFFSNELEKVELGVSGLSADVVWFKSSSNADTICKRHYAANLQKLIIRLRQGR